MSLPPVVRMGAHVLFTLFMLFCVYIVMHVTKYVFRHNIFSKEILFCNNFSIWNQFHVIFFPCV